MERFQIDDRLSIQMSAKRKRTNTLMERPRHAHAEIFYEINLLIMRWINGQLLSMTRTQDLNFDDSMHIDAVADEQQLDMCDVIETSKRYHVYQFSDFLPDAEV